MHAVLPVRHRLGLRNHLEPADFHEQAFVALGAKTAKRSETDIFLAIGNARSRIVAEAKLSASIRELVASGAGISIVEPVTSAIFAVAGLIVARPLRPEQVLRYDFLMPALREPSSAATRVLEMVEQSFSTLLEYWNLHRQAWLGHTCRNHSTKASTLLVRLADLGWAMKYP